MWAVSAIKWDRLWRWRRVRYRVVEPGDDGGVWRPGSVGRAAIKSWSRQTAVNLWRVPGFALRECGEESGTGRYWLSRLAELRKEFEYAVIRGACGGDFERSCIAGAAHGWNHSGAGGA